jgi:hypothetical protein
MLGTMVVKKEQTYIKHKGYCWGSLPGGSPPTSVKRAPLSNLDLDHLGRHCTKQWRSIQLTKYERQPHTVNYCTV